MKAVAVLRRRLLESLALTLALGLTEWVGLFMLVPLLALVGLRDGGGEVGRMADGVSTMLASVGVSPTLPTVLLIFVAVVSARALLQRHGAIVTTALEQEFVWHLRLSLYKAVSRTKWTHFARGRSSDFTHALTTELDRVGTATTQLLSLIGEVGVGVAYIAVAVRISPAMSALAAAAGSALVLALRGWNTKANTSGEQLSEVTAELYSTVQEHLGGFKTARSYGAQKRNTETFAALGQQLKTLSVHASRTYGNSSMLFTIGAAVALGVFVWIAVSVLALPTTAVLLLLLVFSRLIPRFSSVLRGYQLFTATLPSYANIVRIITDCEANAEARWSDEPPPPLHRAVTFRDVCFRYPSNIGDRTITNITLDIPANLTTAIVGSSGAGKSTIADLVLGLIDPESGAIGVDDVALTPDLRRAWRKQIGYVPQDTFLLHDTVRANVLWAEPSATEAQVRTALQQAAAEEFVLRLPQGLDTVVGERGVLLSGGERQRIALARALLRRPALLILDEATSALDSENEQRILRAIADLHGQTTILIITHRLSTIREADLIHVLEEGRMVASGTWDTLLAGESSRFRELCAAQGISPD